MTYTAQVKLSELKPGAGWRARYSRAPVFEREDGLRVHMLGICRLPNGVVIGQAGHHALQHRLIAINGGNRRRGLMAWASHVAATFGATVPGKEDPCESNSN